MSIARPCVVKPDPFHPPKGYMLVDGRDTIIFDNCRKGLLDEICRALNATELHPSVAMEDLTRWEPDLAGFCKVNLINWKIFAVEGAKLIPGNSATARRALAFYVLWKLFMAESKESGDLLWQKGQVYCEFYVTANERAHEETLSATGPERKEKR